ncbi:hypothetical protein I79_023384 [Cricetulus griseus]|uniref:Uncharacterized protein n=1 Tax=Cricetulus griseus TaxID=10029 RepID=G3IHS8_CRIGR|nr:hypothetical protein I79_023384 [Cricetulus griseus]
MSGNQRIDLVQEQVAELCGSWPNWDMNGDWLGCVSHRYNIKTSLMQQICLKDCLSFYYRIGHLSLKTP